MMHTRRLLLSLVVVLLVGCQTIRTAETTTTNLLTNGGFEGGWTRDTLYWVGDTGPFTTEFDEVFTPEGWTSWWIEGVACPGTSDYVTGRPEINFATMAVDPGRIYEGEQAAKLFTFWRCHRMGLYQQVAVVPGAIYALSAYGHSWYSRCSSKPHATQPLDTDCNTPIDWAHDWFSVGMDPYGGMDPFAPKVVWSDEHEIYGIYGESLTLALVQAQSPTMTVFLRAQATHPLKHNDVMWDDVALVSCNCVIFLPVIAKN